MASKKDNLPVNIQEEQEQGSSITYAPEVLNIITLTAVNEVEGIAGLSTANGSLLRKGHTAKGIRRCAYYRCEFREGKHCFSERCKKGKADE